MKVTPFLKSGIYFLALFLLISPESFGQDAEKKLSIFRDSLDGAIDMSDWLVGFAGMGNAYSSIEDFAFYIIFGSAWFR